MATDYTVVVPTYNRAPFLERLFRYFVRAGLQAPLLVADGSEDEGLRANTALIEKYRREGLQIEHYIPPRDPKLVAVGSCRFGYAPRLNLALRGVKTPFVDLLCDDCFASPEFLESAALLLRTDNTASTVVGQMWTITLDLARQSTSLYGPVQQFSLAETGGIHKGKTALQRLIATAGSGAMNSLWAMHRRDNLIRVFGAAQEAIDVLIENRQEADPPGAAEEWALDFLHGTIVNIVSLIDGAVRHVPHLMLGHQYHADNWGLQLSRGPRLNEAIMRRYWALISAPYIESAVKMIIEKEDVSPDDARIAVHAFFWKDMARRLNHTANLRIQSLAGEPDAAQASAPRRHLRRIPGLRAAGRSVLGLPALYRDAKRRRYDRDLSQTAELRFLRAFIESSGAA